MSGPLVLFPARVAIGSAGGVPVYASPEFQRALSDLLARVGGPSGPGTEEVGVEAMLASPMVAAPQDPESHEVLAAQVAQLARQVDALQAELAAARAAGPELAKGLGALETELAIVPNYSAALAQLGTMAKQNANNVAITGGAINGTTIGGTTRSTGRFTTVGVGTGAPAYRFGVSNNGAAGLEFDSDGAAYGVGTTAVLAYNRAGVGGGYVPLHLDASSITMRVAGTRSLAVDATGVGFLGAATAARQNVAGSRAANAALASLITALANFGLITDTTTA